MSKVLDHVQSHQLYFLGRSTMSEGARMTATPPTTAGMRARRDLLVVWSVGLLLSAGIGLAVALLRSEPFWLIFGVFTACFLAPCITLAWFVLGAGRRVEVAPHAGENVESRWLDKAAAGALFDTIPAAGIAAGAVSLFGLDLPGDVALICVVAFALIDGALRYAVLSRRES
jgi:hypothetical protein